MASYSDKETDKLLAELEARILEVYDKAQSEVAKQASDYFASFKDRYEKEYAAYEDGKYTPEQFQAWYLAQVGRGERWNHLRDSLAQRLTEANKVAAAYVNDTTPGIYALNANYQAYEIYKNTGVDFALVDENTIKNLFMSNELDILPLNLNVDESERWNARQLTNAVTSGIIRGQSIGKMANEFQRVTNMDRTSALRNARTATTGAQNAGRQESYNKAADMGIEIEKEWIATEDSRTRESHAELDGVRIKYSATFPNGLEYPGDPNGAPEEVYNCRCTVRAIIPKYNGDQRESHIEGHEGLHTEKSYKQWVDEKREEKMENSKPYTHADATARGIEAAESRKFEEPQSILKSQSQSVNEVIEKADGLSKSEKEKWNELLNNTQAEYIDDPQEESFYDNSNGVINIHKNDPAWVVMHELGHHADISGGSVLIDGYVYQTASTYIDENTNESDRKNDEQNILEIIGITSENKNIQYGIWASEQQEKYGGVFMNVSDIISAVTNNSIVGLSEFGYHKTSYWEDKKVINPTNVSAEILADYISIRGYDNQELIDLVEKLIPNEIDNIKKAYEEVFSK